MNNIKVAVCIPTYNRPEVVREFLDRYAVEYTQHNFDIFIYDSSENNQTEVIVNESMLRYTNLQYVKIDSLTHSNIKVYNIFKEFGDRQDYDYLWICSDSIRWSDCVLFSVSNAVKQGYDIIVPNYLDIENIGDKEYDNANELFLDCAWYMTLYGATILKISTMLTDVDWAMLEKKYIASECINHSHVAFYFEKLYRLNSWKGLHLSFTKDKLIASGLKKHSGWQKETFYVWCYCWPSMINKLPDYYKNKKKVIKKSGVYSGILSFANFSTLRVEKILNIYVYFRYKNQWHELTDVPRIVILTLSILPAKIVECLKYRNSIKSIKWYMKEIWLKRRIKKYCYRFEKIYIYGAGIKARRYTSYLNEMNIKLEAYLVTETSGNEEMINGHKVILYSSSLLQENTTGIILALNEENTKEVMEKVFYNVRRRRIFSEF